MRSGSDLTRTFVHLARDGSAEPIALTPAFFRDARAAARYDRVLGAFDFATGGDLHASMQEMHPTADEVLCVVEGALDLVLEEDGRERTVRLDAGEFAIVPRGVWHRLVVRRPGRLVFVNAREGMQSRRAGAIRGDRKGEIS